MKSDIKLSIYQLKYINEHLTREIGRKDSGERDLAWRISELIPGVLSESLPTVDEQIEKIKIDIAREETENSEILEKDEKNNNLPDWLKAIYRKVAKRSHPDKLSGMDKEDRDDMIETYMCATEAYLSQDIPELLMAASDLNIYPESADKNTLQLLSQRIADSEADIQNTRSSHFWIWAGIPDDQKLTFLVNFLRQSGYDISEEVVEKCIAKEKK